MPALVAKPGSVAAVAVLALALAGGTAFIALRPRPSPPPPVAKVPEWRCADQAKGGPICHRALPPAAKRAG